MYFKKIPLSKQQVKKYFMLYYFCEFYKKIQLIQQPKCFRCSQQRKQTQPWQSSPRLDNAFYFPISLQRHDNKVGGNGLRSRPKNTNQIKPSPKAKREYPNCSLIKSLWSVASVACFQYLSVLPKF